MRLLPAVVICATIIAAVILAADEPWANVWPGYWHSLTFWPFQPWVDGVYWTLAVELGFYALVFVLLVARRLPLIELAMGVFGVFSAVYWTIRALGKISDGHANFVLNGRWLEISPLIYGTYFATGVFLWLGFYRGWTWWRVLIVAICFVGGAGGAWAPHSGGMGDELGPWIPHLPWIIWCIATAAIAASVYWNRIFERLGSRTLAAVRIAGLATYPLYLIHNTTGVALMGGLIRAGLPGYLPLVLSAMAMIALSLLITVTLEPWLRRALAYLLDSAAAGLVRPRPGALVPAPTPGSIASSAPVPPR